MWFRLASAEWQTGKHLGAMDVLANAWSVGYNVSGGITKTSGSGSISKGGTLTAIFTLSTGATFTSATLTPASAGTVTHTVSSSTVTITVKNVSANCTLSVVATGGSVEPETPVNPPSGYTFTINPTPASATVTLSATGYSTVSGTGSKSITVANGTKVNWSVSANGYTTRTGSWTISGGNKTENITLTATSGGGGGIAETDISSLFTSTWREAGGAIIVDSTKSNYGWHQANQSAYRCSGSYVDVTKYTTYFDGKNVKLQITLPRATNSSHVQYGLAFYSNTTVGSTGVADVILGTCPMQYEAADHSNPTVETREITIPAGTKYIKTTWLTAANETTLGAVFSAKIIPN